MSNNTSTEKQKKNELAEECLKRLLEGRKHTRHALCRIKYQKLYVGLGHKTFNKFLTDPDIDFSPSKADREVRAGKIEKRLDLPIGSNPESVYRSLSKYMNKREKLKKIWNAVQTKVKKDEQRLTAKLVEEVTASLDKKKPSKSPVKEEDIFTNVLDTEVEAKKLISKFGRSISIQIATDVLDITKIPRSERTFERTEVRDRRGRRKSR